LLLVTPLEHKKRIHPFGSKAEGETGRLNPICETFRNEYAITAHLLPENQHIITWPVLFSF